jgi:hypothetical protein
MNPPQEFFKSFLTRLGSHLSEKSIQLSGSALNYLEVGRWMHQQGCKVGKRVQAREDVWKLVAAELSCRRQPLYLEFGASSGDNIRYWATLLTGDQCRFVGFDSFEGLPENWTKSYPKGTFTRNGQIPQVDDSRVSFVKGWFHETVPHYAPPAHDVLIVNIDSDLYSSATCVLSALRDSITPGTYVYFDEFNVVHDELRAFDEFIAETGMRFRCVGASSNLNHVAFQRIR